MTDRFAYSRVVATLEERLANHSRQTITLGGFRHSAVAVALVDKDDATYVPLTVRSDALRHHSGQVSLPGGVRDETDVSLADTAKREMEEELGVPQDRLRQLGLCDDVPTPSGFIITPAVFALGSSPSYVCNPAEVAAAFEAPLALFADSHAREDLGCRTLRGITYRLCAFRYGDQRIWGATARILSALASQLL